VGRPPLCRRVSYLPSITYFKPAGIPLRELEEVCISVEELEAIRLKDIEDLEQEQCAEKMNVSRPTFVRILDSARKKVAEALIKGQAIRIEGGNFEMASHHFRCKNSHEWDISPEDIKNSSSIQCPICSTLEISLVSPPNSVFAKHGRCCRRESERQEQNPDTEEASINLKTDAGLKRQCNRKRFNPTCDKTKE
jgi:uncharacterized protein